MKKDGKGLGVAAIITALLAALLLCGAIRGDITIRDNNGNPVPVFGEGEGNE